MESKDIEINKFETDAVSDSNDIVSHVIRKTIEIEQCSRCGKTDTKFHEYLVPYECSDGQTEFHRICVICFVKNK